MMTVCAVVFLLLAIGISWISLHYSAFRLPVPEATSGTDDSSSGESAQFLTNDVASLLKWGFFVLSQWCTFRLIPELHLQGVLSVIVALAPTIVFLCTQLIIIALGSSVKDPKTGENVVLPHFLSHVLISVYRLIAPVLPSDIRHFRLKSSVTELHTSNPAKANAKTMLKGILQFGRETVRDIMTSRLDVTDLDVRTPFNEVVRIVAEDRYSRIPVWSVTHDNIIGILYIKDLLPYLDRPRQFRWSFLIRPQLCVPETKKIDNLLREFQERKIHIAVVIDEYGGVAGIVTLEDIIEEIVGEINDEYDEPEDRYVTLADGTYIFDAKISLQDFCKLFDLNPDQMDEDFSDSDTLAGLLLDLIGDMPHKHQTVDWRQFHFEILGVDERRISKVKVIVRTTEPS
jgi:Mg2+/Co2+ transporter CorC